MAAGHRGRLVARRCPTPPPSFLHVYINDQVARVAMRFRLHQNASSGQASKNKTAIAALSLQLDALQVDVDAISPSEGTSLVTTQVTGDDPVPTVGALSISDADLTTVAFADAFSNGISHALDASIFNVTAAGDYTINVNLHVTAGTMTHRGLYWVICRRYKNRTTTEAIGPAYRDYHIGTGYYRANMVVLGGNVRIHFESPTEQFQIIVQMAYQTEGQDYGVNPIDDSVSYITIEKHDAAGTESADTVESADTIEITSGVNGTFAFQHVDASLQTAKAYSIVLDQPTYTYGEMVTKMNAQISTEGSVQRGTTTAIVFNEGRFVIRCTTVTDVVLGIRVLSGSSAAESLGFGQTQAVGVFSEDEAEDAAGGDLDLVAANTPP